MVVDPRITRNWIQKWVFALLNPLALFFGTLANYFAHLAQLLMGNENWSFGKAFVPTDS